MEMMPIKPERKAELQDYALRHDQDEVSALDSVLADFFAWDKQEYLEVSEGVREGIEDTEAGRVSPADEVFERLRVKHGLPR